MKPRAPVNRPTISLGALAHLAALLLQAASALLLPLPAKLGPGLLVGVGLVRHGAKSRHPSGSTQKLHLSWSR